MPLQLMTDVEASQYVKTLDLNRGSEAARTIASMLLLSAPAFARAVSAIAQGLISLRDIRALPAINDRLIDAMLAARLGTNDPDTVAWRYRDEWLPASIDLVDLRFKAVGSAKARLIGRFDARWNYTVRPVYDFTRTDETAFHSYAEAFIAYMISANDSIVLDSISNFRTVHAKLVREYPMFTQTAQPILRLIERLSEESIFLERQNAGIIIDPLLDWILSGTFRTVASTHVTKFLGIAYGYMAASSDPGRTGAPGALALRNDTVWPTLGAGTNYIWEFDLARMARVFFPQAYGTLVSSPSELSADLQINDAATAYLEAARSVIIKTHETVSRFVSQSATAYRAVPGSPMGLLLTLTLP